MRNACKLLGMFLIYFAIMLIGGLYHSNYVFAMPNFPFAWNDNYLCRMINGNNKPPKTLTAGTNTFWHDLKRFFSGPEPAAASRKVYPIKVKETVCGNGVQESGEECDGNQGLEDNQVCSNDCKLIRLDYCGDGIISVDEFCDDGNTFNGDGCSSYCTFDDIADEALYDLGALPSKQLLIYWPTLPTITNEVRVSNVEEFNLAAGHPWTRIRVEGDLHGDSLISASDIEVIVSEGVKVDFLYIGSGVNRIKISGGEFNEITIKSPITFWPKYQVKYDDVVEDIVIENVTVRSAAYYAFFGMARRFALLNSKFYSESSTFTSENPEEVRGEHYIIAGNEFYSKGPLPNISINGTNRLFFVDNVVVSGNAFNSINLQIDRQSNFAYIARNTFVGTGISLSSDESWVEDNSFYHNRGKLLEARSQEAGLTLIDNTVFSDTAKCLVCGSKAENWIVSKNTIFDYEEPLIGNASDFETESTSDSKVVKLSEPEATIVLPGQERNELQPFFIGNSLLNVWIPKMVDDIADSLGKNNIYAYDETYLTGAGASLRWNFNHPYDGQGADPFVELIQPKKYDALILSDAVPAINFEEETKEFAYRFYQMGLQGNSELELFLFSTWVHKDKLSFSDWATAVDNELAVWERVRSYLVHQSGRETIYIIPGGIALKMLMAEADAGRVPGLASGDALFEEDMIHLNALGNYFMSLVHYVCLYRSNPLDATHITFSPWGGENRPLPDLALASKMQQIAWKVVSAYPNSGVGTPSQKTQCGNGNVEKEEACDDGNRLNGDGCSARCEMELQLDDLDGPECGNGVVESGESCDDGNKKSNDGCSSVCSWEVESEPVEPDAITDGIPILSESLQSPVHETEEESEQSAFPMSNEHLPPSPQVGFNLNWNYDYIQQWIFVDAMKHSRPWRTKSARGWQAWDTEVASEIKWRSDGYPAEIPAKTSKGPQIVYTVMLSNHESGEGVWPAGEYRVFYDGDGDLAFKGDGTVVGQMAGQYTVNVQPTSHLELQIVRSNRNNPVRNIRVIMPGFENTYASNPFHPLFLERLGSVAALKFTYPAVINFHPNGEWAKRVTPQYYSQGTDKGMALEYMVQLANITAKNAWFNLPHSADDEYVRRYAEYLRDKLDANLTIYLEYSNEIWNESFEQSQWLSEKGCKDADTFIPHTNGQDRGVQGCDDFASKVRAAAKRMVEVFEIFDDVFNGQPNRVIKVISGKTDWYEYNNRLWNHFIDPDINPNSVIADAFAIAPYFGRSQTLETVLQGEGGALMSVNSIIDFAHNDLKTTVNDWLDHYGQWTRSRNLLLLAYEAGSDLTYTAKGYELAEKVELASRHPRMAELYSEYINQWKDSGGDLMMMSAYVDLPGVGVTRGVLEYQDQPLGEAYVYQAVMAQTGRSRTSIVCGDGIAQAWELCDDGNRRDGDGCSQYCVKE